MCRIITLLILALLAAPAIASLPPGHPGNLPPSQACLFVVEFLATRYYSGVCFSTVSQQRAWIRKTAAKSSLYQYQWLALYCSRDELKSQYNYLITHRMSYAPPEGLNETPAK